MMQRMLTTNYSSVKCAMYGTLLNVSRSKPYVLILDWQKNEIATPALEKITRWLYAWATFRQKFNWLARIFVLAILGAVTWFFAKWFHWPFSSCLGEAKPFTPSNPITKPTSQGLLGRRRRTLKKHQHQSFHKFNLRVKMGHKTSVGHRIVSRLEQVK